MLRDPALIPLSHDHQHALALCVLVERALAAGTDPDEQRLKIVQHFDREMHAHFAKEEQILFPSLLPFPELQNIIEALLSDHREIRQLVDSFRTQAAPAQLLSFVELLRRHVRREERELFESAQRLLSPSQIHELGLRLKSPAH